LDTIKQQSGVLDSFAGVVGGGKQPSFIEKGSSLLTSLLGSHDQSAVVGAVGKFAGLGQNGANSLMGMLTPVVMGLIGKQIGPRLDVSASLACSARRKSRLRRPCRRAWANCSAAPGSLIHLLAPPDQWPTPQAKQVERHQRPPVRPLNLALPQPA